MQNKEIKKAKEKIKDYIDGWRDSLTDEDGYTKGTLDEDSENFICAIENILQYTNQLENKVKEVIQQLKIKYEQLTQSVKRYEDMRRNCKDEFYLKSYQTSIHRLNAKRETISNIIDLLEK